jgi:hypothetical protein
LFPFLPQLHQNFGYVHLAPFVSKNAPRWATLFRIQNSHTHLLILTSVVVQHLRLFFKPSVLKTEQTCTTELLMPVEKVGFLPPSGRVSGRGFWPAAPLRGGGPFLY